MMDLRILFEDDGPDRLGRRTYFLLWNEPDGVFRHELGKDGAPVGYRRGQIFKRDPTKDLERARLILKEP